MPPNRIHNPPTELTSFVKAIDEHHIYKKGNILVTLNTHGLGKYYDNTDGCTGILKEWNGFEDEALVSVSDGESSGQMSMINICRYGLGRKEYHVHPLYLKPTAFGEGMVVINRNGQPGVVVEYSAQHVADPTKYRIRLGDNELPTEPQYQEYFQGEWFVIRDDDDSDYE